MHLLPQTTSGSVTLAAATAAVAAAAVAAVVVAVVAVAVGPSVDCSVPLAYLTPYLGYSHCPD